MQRLRDDGDTVVVLDRTGDVSCDLGRTHDVRAAARVVLERYGRFDVLVHAAAAFDFMTLGEFDLETWQRVQAVNVDSLMLLSQAFVPGMRTRRFGRIIAVVSNTFRKPPGPDRLSYIASPRRFSFA